MKNTMWQECSTLKIQSQNGMAGELFADISNIALYEGQGIITMVMMQVRMPTIAHTPRVYCVLPAKLFKLLHIQSWAKASL